VRISELAVPGAYRIDPDPFPDVRGDFYETVRYSVLRDLTGHELTIRQVSYSTSHKHVVRGVHTTPGEAKLITCVRGAAVDVAVDLRVGSPTFGQHSAVRLGPDARTSVYLPVGFGHAFHALTDDTCMSYACSAEYVPGTMLVVDALDPNLALPWNLTAPAIRSEQDARAPSLEEVVAAGVLPTYEPV
jgi:NDP-hexose 3,5-(Or5-) epimerase